MLVPAGAAALVLLAGMVMADAGAIAYRAGSDAAARGDWEEELAARGSGRDRSLAPRRAKVTGGRRGARRPRRPRRDAAESAVEPGHNPGDAPSSVNLAILCEEQGDADCQARATERAVATAGFFEAELLNAAISYEELGMADEADDAYERSLLSQPLTAFALDWPRDIPIGDSTLEDDFGALLEFNRLLGWWAMGEPIDAASIADPATRALAHGMRGERSEAGEWLERAIDTAPDSIVTWDVAIVLRDHWGLPIDDELAIAEVVRGGPFPDRNARNLDAQPELRHRDVPDLPGRRIRQRAQRSGRARRTPGSSRDAALVPLVERQALDQGQSRALGPDRRRDREPQPALAGIAESIARVQAARRDAGEPEPGQCLGEERSLTAERVRDDTAVAVRSTLAR